MSTRYTVQSWPSDTTIVGDVHGDARPIGAVEISAAAFELRIVHTDPAEFRRLARVLLDVANDLYAEAAQRETDGNVETVLERRLAKSLEVPA